MWRFLESLGRASLTCPTMILISRTLASPRPDSRQALLPVLAAKERQVAAF